MDILNDWYETNFGFRPADEDLSITEAEMTALCRMVEEALREEIAANDNVKGTRR